jgi:UDP-N-acetyl-D-mannosaminuronate dehydrogenase
VKETAFSGVFAAVDALAHRGAIALVHDPLYTDDELVSLGFTPYHLGQPVNAAVVQADHAEYRTLTPDDLPGITAFIDGRKVSSQEHWPNIACRVIGKTRTN